jgi:hypothetical protein
MMEHDSINWAAGQDEGTVADARVRYALPQTALPRSRVADIVIHAAPGYRVAIAVRSLEQERNAFQKLHMGRAAGAHATRSAGNAERNGKVRQGMPDFPIARRA